MIEVMKHGDKFKNYFPDGKKIKFTCWSCGCVFKVTAPDENVKYYVNREEVPGLFKKSIAVSTMYFAHCPECGDQCLCKKKV